MRLGATLFWCLSGRPPFVTQGQSDIAASLGPAAAWKSRRTFEPFVPSVPEGLEAILNHLLAIQPGGSLRHAPAEVSEAHSCHI